MKKTLALLLAIIMIAGLSACGAESPAPAAPTSQEASAAAGNDAVDESAAEPIKVGFINDLTGDSSAWGVPALRGVEMTVEEVNSNGGVLGRQIELIPMDNKGDPQDSCTAFSKLVDEGCIAVVGGTTSSCNIAMAPLADQAKIPLIGMGCSNDLVTVDENGNLHPYSFRITYVDSFQGTAMGKYIARAGYDTCALFINEADALSICVAEFFRDAYEANGGTIVASEEAYGTDNDFRAQLTNIKAADPDIVFMPWDYTNAALIAQQARGLGIDCPLAGSDSWDSKSIGTLSKGTLEGCFFCAKPLFMTEESQAFEAEYLAKYTDETVCEGETLHGVDAIAWLIQAIEETGSTDSDVIRDYLEHTVEFDGLVGMMTIDPETHNPEREVAIYEIHGEDRVYRETIALD